MPSNSRIRAAVLTLLRDLRDGSRRESPVRDLRDASRRKSPAPAAHTGHTQASPRPPRRIYELGSGWGGLSRHIAREHPDISVTGIERSLIPYLFSRLMLAVRRLPNLRFRFQDFNVMFSEEQERPGKAEWPGRADRANKVEQRGGSSPPAAAAGPDVIIAYLSPRHMQSLAAKLPTGHDVTLISAAFALPGRQPDREIRVSDLYRTPVYRYDLIREPVRE